jgi:FtsH-binding integral membrane protein
VGPAIVAVAACLGCLALSGVSSLLDGRLRSILLVPLAIAFFWGFVALVGSVLAVIFSEGDEEPTRLRMLFAAAYAVTFALAFLALASLLDPHVHAVAFGLRFLAAAGFWVFIGCVLGAIFGKLPEIGMAEGD